MVVYVTLVAILNLCLGMVLGRIMPPSRIMNRRQPRRSPQAESSRPIPAELTSGTVEFPKSSVVTPEATAPDCSSTPNTEEEAEQRGSRTAPPGHVKTWAEFAQQLRDVKDRTRYCRPAQDIQLARQAAEQLRTCGLAWYAQFEKCLTGEPLDEATQTLVEGADPNAIEMFAAQIETTITNLGAIDWTDSVDNALDCLEREISLLDGQQKAVLNSTKKPTVKS
jgi:hypothetical protein